MTTRATSDQICRIDDVVFKGRHDTGGKAHLSASWDGLGAGCPATTPELRPILDVLVSRIEEARARHQPGWIVEIGCGHGRWTEWIAMTMKSHHSGFGELRQKLILLDGSASTLQFTQDHLRSLSLPEPDAMRVCHDGRFTLDRPAEVVFSFDTFEHYNLKLMNAYFGSVAECLRAGGRFLITLACERHPSPAEHARADHLLGIAVKWSSQGLKFHSEIQATLERHFTWAVPEAVLLPVGSDRVFVEFTRK